MDDRNCIPASTTSDVLHSTLLIFALVCSSFALGLLQNSRTRTKRSLVIHILPLGKSHNQVKIFTVKKNAASENGRCPNHDSSDYSGTLGVSQDRYWMFKLFLALSILAIFMLNILHFNPEFWMQINHNMWPNVTSKPELLPMRIEMIPIGQKDDDQQIIPNTLLLDEPQPEESRKSWIQSIASDFLYWLFHPIRVDRHLTLRLL